MPETRIFFGGGGGGRGERREKEKGEGSRIGTTTSAGKFQFVETKSFFQKSTGSDKLLVKNRQGIGW